MHACYKQCVSSYYRKSNKKFLINSDSEEQLEVVKGLL